MNAIISSSTDNIMFVDTANRISLLNQAAYTHFNKINYRPVQVGEDVINIIPADRQQILKKRFLNSAIKRRLEPEHKVTYANGGEVWLYRKFYAVHDEQN